MTEAAEPQQGPSLSERLRGELRQENRTRALARLRQATWEATQYMTDDEIREYVNAVLREVESDAP